MTRVGHVNGGDAGVYIGRKRHGFHYGNPASHLPRSIAAVHVGSLSESLQFYDEWLDGKYPDVEPARREWVLRNIPKLENQTLLCFCSRHTRGWKEPPECHGDILARRANAPNAERSAR